MAFWREALDCAPMIEPLSNPQLRRFKAAAQLLEPMFKMGKAGLSDGFVRSVDEALSQHELVKIKFAEFKEQKKELAPLLAEKTASHLIMRAGNVMVLHRPKEKTETLKAEILKTAGKTEIGKGA